MWRDKHTITHERERERSHHRALQGSRSYSTHLEPIEGIELEMH